MATDTTPETPLAGMISCGSCGAPMHYDEATEEDEALYACHHEHQTGTEVRIQAHSTDRQVISSVLTAILTDKNITTLQSALRKYQLQEDTDSSLPAEDTTLLREHLSLFLTEAGSAEQTGNFLTTFITDIRLFPDRAVVHYAMPLPADSHLAGATEQEVSLSPSPAP